MAASDSASIGRQVLELHSDLAEEIRSARTAPPGLAYISDLTDTATEVFQTSGGVKASETPNLQMVTSVGQTGESRRTDNCGGKSGALSEVAGGAR